MTTYTPAQKTDQANSETCSDADHVISLKQARLSLGSSSGQVDILKEITLDIPARQSVAVLGPSGAGKTSLLMVMSGLEQLSSGTVRLAGTDVTAMDEDKLARIRRDHVGIVFQAFRLIPSMTAIQNVAVPLELGSDPEAQNKAKAALEALGLGERLHHLPEQLSGGEQQRVAIARAIAPRPSILLADEPTGNLDSVTGQKVIEQLFRASESVGAALVLVTHDETLALRCERILRIDDGRLSDDRMNAGISDSLSEQA